MRRQTAALQYTSPDAAVASAPCGWGSSEHHSRPPECILGRRKDGGDSGAAKKTTGERCILNSSLRESPARVAAQDNQPNGTLQIFCTPGSRKLGHLHSLINQYAMAGSLFLNRWRSTSVLRVRGRSALAVLAYCHEFKSSKSHVLYACVINLFVI